MTYSILGRDVSFDNGRLLDLEVLADLRRRYGPSSRP